MWDLWCIRCYVDLDSAKLLATALVYRRLDYCNSLLHGIADTDLNRPQCIQNRLACFLTKSPPFTQCSTAFFPSLVASKVWNIVQDQFVDLQNHAWKTACLYLHSMLAASLPSCSLRWNKGISLSVPRVKTNARALHSCAPSLCYNFPLSVHSAMSHATFKKHLNTHLFDLTFPPIETGTTDGLLMLWNCFIEFAVEHWFSCCGTGPGFAGRYWCYRNLSDRFITLVHGMMYPAHMIHMSENQLAADPSWRNTVICT